MLLPRSRGQGAFPVGRFSPVVLLFWWRRTRRQAYEKTGAVRKKQSDRRSSPCRLPRGGRRRGALEPRRGRWEVAVARLWFLYRKPWLSGGLLTVKDGLA